MAKNDLLGVFEQLVLLALVQLDDQGYGVSVCRAVEERTGRKVTLGAVYATLDRLERKGYVRSRVGEPTAERGGRAKRLFRVEAAGLKSLRHSLETVERMRAGMALGRLRPEGA
ncbi:MAG TPA: PadR family transcriptional regulator [Phycisphaerae bacterium]|nr:helix-turn-helix transcriptional regulator [Phycisphaerales bacterium]HRX85708.1 PadR family transcriptional regulator [Phycisphaerae bacterium]